LSYFESFINFFIINRDDDQTELLKRKNKTDLFNKIACYSIFHSISGAREKMKSSTQWGHTAIFDELGNIFGTSNQTHNYSKTFLVKRARFRIQACGTFLLLKIFICWDSANLFCYIFEVTSNQRRACLWLTDKFSMSREN